MCQGKSFYNKRTAKAEEPIEEIGFDKFFERLTTIRDWFCETETATAKKFLDLRKRIEENLIDLKVFKIGKLRISIDAVVIDKDGRLMGVMTEAVETQFISAKSGSRH